MPEERSTNSKYLNLTFYTTGSSLMFDFFGPHDEQGKHQRFPNGKFSYLGDIGYLMMCKFSQYGIPTYMYLLSEPKNLPVFTFTS